MAASISGAIKQVLEGAGLGVAVYRDQAPPGQTMPYVTVEEMISLSKSFSGNGDHGDPDAAVVAEEQVQVNVWQQWKHPTSGALEESYTLTRNIISRLDGATLTTAPTHVSGMRLAHAVRLVEEDNNVVHDAVTMRIARHL